MNPEQIAGGPAASGTGATAPAPGPPGGLPRVVGACHVLFAYDLGATIDLDAAAARLGPPPALRRDQRSPAWLNWDPPPLRVAAPAAAAVEIDGFRTEADPVCTLYDFGAASIAWRIPIDGPLDRLPALGSALYENEALLGASRRELAALLRRLGPDGRGLRVGDVAEDYVVFAVQSWTPASRPADLIAAHRGLLAALVLAETGSVSEQQVSDCLANPLSYAPDDVAIAHWNGAILFDPAPDDVLTILEHANVELVELRNLDRRLDRMLRRARAMMARPGPFVIWPLSPEARDARQLAETQVNSALMFEGLKNAVKLVENQYLSDVYRLAAAKLQLPAWDANVQRKIDTADRIFEKITHRQSTRRLETLEIIIIVLILIEVVRPFIPWMAGH